MLLTNHPHEVGKYVGGILVQDEWRGRFHVPEMGLWQELEADYVTELEAVLIMDMIQAAQVYDEWWKSLSY